MAQLFSFHQGPPLNLWERCSLQSFADLGHDLVLFSYGKLDVPQGVSLAPARDIIPEEKFRDFIGRAPDQFAQFSDWFRYALLYRHGNWWVDTDVVCTTPSLPDDDVVFAKAVGPGWLNGGVIKFPANHPLLADALDYCDSHWREVASSHRSMLGPFLITELVDKYKLRDRVQNLSPVRGKRVWDFGDPAKRDDVAALFAGCPVIHWWQWWFRAAGLPRDVLPPRDSFLAEHFLLHGGEGHPHLALETYRAAAAAARRARAAVAPAPAKKPQTWQKRLARWFGGPRPGKRGG